MPRSVTRVLAVDKLRKVNALFGFTRIDDMDRVNDLPARLAPLTRDRKPRWTVATEDRGEGIFLQFDEAAVAAWEATVEDSAIWAAHGRRTGATTPTASPRRPRQIDPDDAPQAGRATGCCTRSRTS